MKQIMGIFKHRNSNIQTILIVACLILIIPVVCYSQDDETDLNLKYKDPITIQLTGAGLKQIFSTFAQIGRINILFDETVPVTKIVPSFSVKDIPFSKALNILLKTNSLAGIQVDPETVIIVPLTKYQQYIKSTKKVYQLSYIESNKLVPIIQAIFGPQPGEPPKSPLKLIVEEKSNLLIVLSTKETIEEIDKFIKEVDLKLAQAIIELKIVEASKERRREYGIELTDYQISSTKLLPKENFVKLTFSDFPALLKFLQTNSEVKILASPNIRVVNKQKAQITIADQVPVQISTTQISTSTTGGATPSAFTTTQVQFFDIGIKLNVTPTIHLDNEITMDLTVEISSLGKATTSGIPEIGKRSAQTTIRLKDGETAIMGGLKKEEERESTKGLPFLSDIPLIGVLFRSTTKQVMEAEIILSITPHIIPANYIPVPVKN